MKKIKRIILCAIYILSAASGFAADVREGVNMPPFPDWAYPFDDDTDIVPVDAVAQSNGIAFTFYLNATYTVYRKDIDADAWGAVYASPSISAAPEVWLDTDVAEGEAYEYRFVYDNNESYMTAGRRFDQAGYRGRLILLLERSLLLDLSGEIDRFKRDLVGDGWKLETLEAMSGEDWKDAREDASQTTRSMIIREQIQEIYNAAPPNDKPKTVVLLGHLPVARSGLSTDCPDGHEGSQGAFATDNYYAEMDGIWTDGGTNLLGGSDKINYPNDGKWDQDRPAPNAGESQNGGHVEMGFGRVDAHALSVFQEGEADRLRRYLNKEHRFRHSAADFQAGRKTFVAGRSGVDLWDAYVFRGTYRNSIVISGLDNLQIMHRGDWGDFNNERVKFSNNNGPYLLFQTQGGAMSGDGFGAEAFRNYGGKAVLWTSAQSHEYRWAADNAARRVPLFSKGFGLSVFGFAGLPHLEYHQIGLGFPIGDGLKRMHNEYADDLYDSHSNYSDSQGRQFIHLNGNPALRYVQTKPASNLTASVSGNDVNLAWDASSDTNIEGYYLFRSTNGILGDYTQLNGSNLVTGTIYTDSGAPAGAKTYMVRAVQLMETGSGSFLNGAQGVFASVADSTEVLRVATTTLASGFQGVPYIKTQLVAQDAVGSIAWDIEDGTLPSGLSFTPEGMLSGTPTELGSFDVVFRVKDSLTNTAARAFSLLVVSADNTAPIVTISNAVDGLVILEGTTTTVSAVVGYDIEDGDLTGTWNSSLDGDLGTAETLSTENLSAGIHLITLSATDSGGATGRDGWVVVVETEDSAPPTGTTISAPGDGSAHEYDVPPTLSGSADSGNLTWVSSIDGILGTGASINQTLSSGSHQIVLVADGASGSATAHITVTIGEGNAAPTISGSPATQSVMDFAYSFTPTANDADGDPLSFSINTTPSWATFNTNNGTLSGTPTAMEETKGIIISVSDGIAPAVTLPSFNIEVVSTQLPELLLHYTFDEATNSLAVDQSGSTIHHDGLIHGGATHQSAGAFSGQSLSLDGNNDFVEPTELDEITFDCASDSFTHSIWFKDSSGSTDETLLSQRKKIQSHETSMFLILNADGTLTGGVGGNTVTTAGTYRDDLWHMATVVNRITSTEHTLLFYLDGVEQGEINANANRKKGTLLIGADFNGTATTNHYAGLLDDVQVYSGGLSSNQIWNLYSGAATLEVRGYGNVITNGDSNAHAADATAFGTLSLAGEKRIHQFEMRNLGRSNLTVSAASITGLNSDDFEWFVSPVGTIEAGSSRTFSVRFKPSYPGERTAQISLTNDGTDPTPYTFVIQGNGAGMIDLDRETLDISEGTTNGFQVRLTAQPIAQSTVSVAWVSGDTDITVTSGSSLIFTTSNWNDWQPVTLSAAEDLDWVANAATIECSMLGEVSKTLVATEIENDEEVLIETSIGALDVPEGATASFQIHLSARPTSIKTVEVAKTSGDIDITVQSGSELIFTQSNWSTNQTVTLAAAQDTDWNNDSATIRCSADGLADRTVTATESDDETDPAYSLPWEEPFDARANGAIAGQNGWTGTGTVQTETTQSGAKALSLSESSVAHSFDGNPSNIWITLWAQPVPGIEPETIASGASAVFYVNTNNHLVAYNSTNATEVVGGTVSNGWNKIEVSCDYVSKVWNLELNETWVVSNYAFHGSPTTFQALEISENTTNTLFVDSITVSDTSDESDQDGDGIPDSWEQKHYGGSTNAIATNRCSNGINTIREAYIAGLDPTNATSLFKVSDLSSKSSGSVLSWNATNGRVYSVYWSSNLLSPFVLLTNDLSWTSSVFTDETHNAESKGFYKIEVELEK